MLFTTTNEIAHSVSNRSGVDQHLIPLGQGLFDTSLL